MKQDSDYHSFLIRLWWDSEAGGTGRPPAWQGEMVNIQTGKKWPLPDLEEALFVLKAAIEDK
jgi:hypothetical protein